MKQTDRERFRALGSLSFGASALAVSAALLVLRLALTNHFVMIDLTVYLQGARHLLSGQLYSFFTAGDHLPFTYPPFAAICFLPLAWLPVPAVKVLWLLGCGAALVATVDRILGWLGRRSVGRRRWGTDLAITAVALWFQPVTQTLSFGQVNTMLMAIVVTGVLSRSALRAGACVGLAAGIKLIPVTTAVFFALVGRWRATMWTVVTAAATVGIGFLLTPRQATTYFFSVSRDPGRAGLLSDTNNQALRGVFARLAPTETTAAWLLSSAVVGVFGLWVGRRFVRGGDLLGALLTVQLVTLLVSPISWDHHWVWVVPLVIWAACRAADTRSAAAAGIALLWTALALSNLMNFRVGLKHDFDTVSRSWGQLLLDDAYAIAGLIALVLMGVLAASRHRAAPPGVPAVPGPVRVG